MSDKGTTRTRTRADDGEALSAEERAAVKARARELKAASRRRADPAEGEREVLLSIAAMADADRAIAERVHALVTAAGPGLQPRTWYGMPAYALDGRVVCFLQDAGKFKARYATLGFNDAARLDDGPMWATSFALLELTPAVEERISELVRRAIG